jgi:hypothetical protein
MPSFFHLNAMHVVEWMWKATPIIVYYHIKRHALIASVRINVWWILDV